MRDQRELIEGCDYDILIVLDACRADAFRNMWPEAQCVNGIAPHTNIWVRETAPLWINEDYTYITAQPQVNAMCHRYDYDMDIVNVWQRDFGWWTEEDIGVVHPISTACVGIEWYHTHGQPCVIHFTQPHGPHIGRPPLCCRDRYGCTDEATAVREMYRGGELEAETYARAYRGNLRLALRAVDLLLQNVDANVAITGDHGESLGEEGRIWHSSSATPDQAPELYQVPWLQLEAEDTVPQQIEDRLWSQGHAGVEEIAM